MLTGEGEMISGVSDSDNPDITDFLKKQNSELMAKIELLNQEIGELKNELKSIKKEMSIWVWLPTMQMPDYKIW